MFSFLKKHVYLSFCRGLYHAAIFSIKKPLPESRGHNMRYHLLIRDFLRNLPHGVLSHSCAISGAPVSAYCASCAVRTVAPGCISQWTVVSFHRPDTLCRQKSKLLLPFVALAIKTTCDYNGYFPNCKEENCDKQRIKYGNVSKMDSIKSDLILKGASCII